MHAGSERLTSRIRGAGWNRVEECSRKRRVLERYGGIELNAAQWRGRRNCARCWPVNNWGRLDHLDRRAPGSAVIAAAVIGRKGYVESMGSNRERRRRARGWVVHIGARHDHLGIAAKAERHNHDVPVVGNADADQGSAGIGGQLITVEIKGSAGGRGYLPTTLGVGIGCGSDNGLVCVASRLRPRTHVEGLGDRASSGIGEDEGLLCLPGGSRSSKQVDSGIVAR